MMAMKSAGSIRITLFISILIFVSLSLGCSTYQLGKTDDQADSMENSSIAAENKNGITPEKTENLGRVINVKNNLNIRSSPSVKGKPIGKLKLGDDVAIHEEQMNWYKITRKDEAGNTIHEGWVSKKYIEKLPPSELPAQVADSTAGDESSSEKKDKGGFLGGVTSLWDKATKNKDENAGFVINVKDVLSVRSTSSSRAKSIDHLYLGDKVILNKEEKLWCYVSRANAKGDSEPIGWVENKYIDKLGPEEHASSLTELAYIRAENATDDDDIEAMKNRTVGQAMLLNATIGGAAGAAKDLISRGEIGPDTLLGIGFGALIGYIHGDYIAYKRKDFDDDKTYLDACILESMQHNLVARRQLYKLEKAIATTGEEIRIIKYKIDDIYLQKQRAEFTRNTLAKLRGDTDKIVKNLNRQMNAQQTAFENVSEDAEKLKNLQQEINITKQQISELEELRDELTVLEGKFGDIIV